MTTLLFDTVAMDQTAGMLRDGAGEYQMLSSQVSADADLASMPAQTAAWVADVISSVSQTLAQLTSALSSDGELLAWRSEEARLADDPSLGALAETIFGTSSAVGLSSSLAEPSDVFASGFDPLGAPAGCAGCIGGYTAVTYDPTGQEPTSDTGSSAAWGEGSYESIYTGDTGDTVVVPLEDPWGMGPSDGTTVVTLDDPFAPPAGDSVVVPLDAPAVPVGGSSVTVDLYPPDQYPPAVPDSGSVTVPVYPPDQSLPAVPDSGSVTVDLSNLVHDLEIGPDPAAPGVFTVTPTIEPWPYPPSSGTYGGSVLPYIPGVVDAFIDSFPGSHAPDYPSPNLGVD